jgi:hypothetical protein
MCLSSFFFQFSSIRTHTHGSLKCHTRATSRPEHLSPCQSGKGLLSSPQTLFLHCPHPALPTPTAASPCEGLFRATAFVCSIACVALSPGLWYSALYTKAPPVNMIWCMSENGALRPSWSYVFNMVATGGASSSWYCIDGKIVSRAGLDRRFQEGREKWPMWF